MIKKAILIIGLLLVGFMSALIIWFLVFLPARILQPMDFAPLELQNSDFKSAEEKLSSLSTAGTAVTLTTYETAAILKTAIENELGVPVTGLFLNLRKNGITAVFMTQISDIPSSGYLTLLLRKRDAEYTSTLISADVKASGGGLVYRITDFRIGNFKVPRFILKRLVQHGPKRFDTVYITDIEIDDEAVRIAVR